MNGKVLQSQEKFFWGIISSSFEKRPNIFLKEQMKKLLGSGGALIFVYSEKFNKFNKAGFIKRWEIDSSIKEDQIVCLSLERELLVDGKLNSERSFDMCKKSIEKLKNKGYEKIMLLTTRGSFWTSKVDSDQLYIYHTKLKKITREENVVVAIRYIIDGFNEENFLKLILLHDLFIFNDLKKKGVYTYTGLIKNAITCLSGRELAQKEHERGLRRMERLKTMDYLLEGMAHDFNNLLSTIIGCSQIGLLKDSKEEIKECLKVINKTALDARNIMNKMQNYTKGCYDSKKGLCKINDIVDESLDMAEHRIKLNKNIKIIKDLKSNSMIYCDEYEIRQVILNIILNALDSMKKQGILAIKTYDLKNKVVLEIMDTGMGMSEKVREKIFEPYFTTKGVKGTGLGLNISSKILKEHSAEIEVESEEGEGSKFSICFPIDEYWMEEDYISDKAGKVLVVSDDYIEAYKIVELLSLLNINGYVKFLEDSILEKYPKQTFDLIIGIYSSTNTVGMECLKRIKREHLSLPLILVVDDEEKVEDELLRISDYVIKDNYSIEKLAEGIIMFSNYIDIERDKSYNIN